MATKRKVTRIDLSSLFGDDDADGNLVDVSSSDVVEVITYTPPTHLTLSVRDCVCRGCGSQFREHLGIFTEYHKGDTMRLQRLPAEADLSQYEYLPRRVDFAPPQSLPACNLCWFAEALVKAAIPHPGERIIPDNLLPSLEL